MANGVTPGAIPFDRRNDLGGKIWTGVITAIFLFALGISIRAYEKNHALEIRMTKVESFMENQDKLNVKLDEFLNMRWQFAIEKGRIE